MYAINVCACERANTHFYSAKVLLINLFHDILFYHPFLEHYYPFIVSIDVQCFHFILFLFNVPQCGNPS